MSTIENKWKIHYNNNNKYNIYSISSLIMIFHNIWYLFDWFSWIFTHFIWYSHFRIIIALFTSRWSASFTFCLFVYFSSWYTLSKSFTTDLDLFLWLFLLLFLYNHLILWIVLTVIANKFLIIKSILRKTFICFYYVHLCRQLISMVI